jgi:hypothetical protein
MTASNRWLVIVAGVIAIAVVAGIAVTTLAAGERTYPEGSPERTVQDYLRAVSKRDVLGATSYLTPELQTRCEKTPRDAIMNRTSTSIRATLDRATIRADRQAEVHVRLTEAYNADSPFSDGGVTSTQVFLLTQSGGQWRFGDPPWPLYCPEPPPVK